MAFPIEKTKKIPTKMLYLFIKFAQLQLWKKIVKTKT